MIRYYARYDETGKLLCIGSVMSKDDIPGEIAAEEYEALKSTIPEPEPVEPVDEVEEALEILRGESE